jgi:multifunctional 2-oxoglutarate metabolism enzyme
MTSVSAWPSSASSSSTRLPKEEIAAELERYKAAGTYLWVQEEPANMGAWWYIRQRLDEVLEELHGDCQKRVRYVGRHASASTATGSNKMHERQQDAIVRRALGRE